MADFKVVEGDPDALQPEALHQALCRLGCENPKPGYLAVMAEHGNVVRSIRSGKGHTLARDVRQDLADAIASRLIPDIL